MSSIRGIVKDIIIVATCVAVVWIGLTAYFGAQNPFYVVSSGSMYPELAMHDIIVISGHALFEDVKIGDIIVFDRPKDHDKVIVHRVVAVVDDDPLTLRTKGDNNQNSIVGTDYPITEEEYKGTVIHVIPQVGYITKILQPPINYIIIVVIIGIMIIRQIAKNKAGKHYEQVKAEPEKIEADLSWLDNYKNASKDFTTQEKKSTEKPEENTKSEGIPEFFLDREKESEEKK
ncbi:MAG: signal peptidase I [Thaumarchaeota archaeon]|nr:signal peptidase I [Nitrososphaerota archaeon]